MYYKTDVAMLYVEKYTSFGIALLNEYYIWQSTPVDRSERTTLARNSQSRRHSTVAMRRIAWSKVASINILLLRLSFPTSIDPPVEVASR